MRRPPYTNGGRHGGNNVLPFCAFLALLAHFALAFSPEKCKTIMPVMQARKYKPKQFVKVPEYVH